MRILGVDPGLANMGLAVIQINQNKKHSYIKSFTVKTSTKLNIAKRLDILYSSIKSLIIDFNIKELAIEQTLVNNNPHSSIDLAMAKAVVLLASNHLGINFFEFSPTTIKKRLTGSGIAKKEQIYKMIKYYIDFSFLEENITSHESDAIAIALCRSFEVNLS